MAVFMGRDTRLTAFLLALMLLYFSFEAGAQSKNGFDLTKASVSEEEIFFGGPPVTGSLQLTIRNLSPSKRLITSVMMTLSLA